MHPPTLWNVSVPRRARTYVAVAQCSNDCTFQQQSLYTVAWGQSVSHHRRRSSSFRSWLVHTSDEKVSSVYLLLTRTRGNPLSTAHAKKPALPALSLISFSFTAEDRGWFPPFASRWSAPAVADVGVSLTSSSFNVHWRLISCANTLQATPFLLHWFVRLTWWRRGSAENTGNRETSSHSWVIVSGWLIDWLIDYRFFCGITGNLAGNLSVSRQMISSQQWAFGEKLIRKCGYYWWE